MSVWQRWGIDGGLDIEWGGEIARERHRERRVWEQGKVWCKEV